MSVNDSITKGLDKALAFASGQGGAARVQQTSIHNIDVAEVRR